MAVAKNLQKYLKENRVSYKAARHKVAYTAQEIAAAQHVPGKQLVKSVLVKTGKDFSIAVLPAIYLIDFKALKKLSKAKSVSLAHEKDMAAVIPDYEPGAMPPFGNLYNLPVYVEKSLTEGKEIVFNAGSHTDTIKMKYKDFEKLAKPKVGNFGKHVSKAKRR